MATPLAVRVCCMKYALWPFIINLFIENKERRRPWVRCRGSKVSIVKWEIGPCQLIIFWSAVDMAIQAKINNIFTFTLPATNPVRYFSTLLGWLGGTVQCQQLEYK